MIAILGLLSSCNIHTGDIVCTVNRLNLHDKVHTSIGKLVAMALKGVYVSSP